MTPAHWQDPSASGLHVSLRWSEQQATLHLTPPWSQGVITGSAWEPALHAGLRPFNMQGPAC